MWAFCAIVTGRIGTTEPCTGRMRPARVQIEVTESPIVERKCKIAFPLQQPRPDLPQCGIASGACAEKNN